MPAVFVHGVPDTHRVWRAVVDRLVRKDVVTLSLPGFGCPLPDGFPSTKEAYVDWLLGTLEAIEGPIDLVGHDWGALLVARAVSLSPKIVRSWTGGGGPVDSTYVWHETAQMWQTPEVGEQVMASFTTDALVEGLSAAGVGEAEARETACHVDETMKSCILRLYRSAVTVGAEWEPDLGRITAPGLLLWGALDPYAGIESGRRMAEKSGAKFVGFDGCGHWWQLERPDEVARALEAHWTASAAQE